MHRQSVRVVVDSHYDRLLSKATHDHVQIDSTERAILMPLRLKQTSCNQRQMAAGNPMETYFRSRLSRRIDKITTITDRCLSSESGQVEELLWTERLAGAESQFCGPWGYGAGLTIRNRFASTRHRGVWPPMFCFAEFADFVQPPLTRGLATTRHARSALKSRLRSTDAKGHYTKSLARYLSRGAGSEVQQSHINGSESVAVIP